MRIRHSLKIITFIVTAFLIIIACQHISNFLIIACKLQQIPDAIKVQKSCGCKVHLLIRCVAHDKNIDFMAKRYSDIIVAACLNAKKID